MSKGKMTSVEVNEAKRIHEQMIDQEWRRSISSGQDIERSEIAELMASDSDSTSEAEFCFEDEERSGCGDSSSDYDKPLSEMAKKYSGEKQSKINLKKWKKSVPKQVESNDVSTSSDDDDLCEKISNNPLQCTTNCVTINNGKSKSHWISKKKTVTAPWISKRKTGPVTVKKGKKRRKRKVKKPLGLDPFQQANFAKHYKHNFCGF